MELDVIFSLDSLISSSFNVNGFLKLKNVSSRTLFRFQVSGHYFTKRFSLNRGKTFHAEKYTLKSKL